MIKTQAQYEALQRTYERQGLTAAAKAMVKYDPSLLLAHAKEAIQTHFGNSPADAKQPAKSKRRKG